MAPFNSAVLQTHITINAPPEEVRAAFLDFTRAAKMQNTFLTTLTAYASDGKQVIQAVDAQPGDRIQLSSVSSIIGDSMNAIFVNTPTKFGWIGGHGGLVAHHTFEFLPSQEGDGKTLFKHEETFEKGAAFLFWWGSPMRFYFDGLFHGFNQDFRTLVEDGGTAGR